MTIIGPNSIAGINSITIQSSSITFYDSTGSKPDISNLDDVSLTSINGGPISGTRNRIINGSMIVDQRNSGVSTTFTAGGALQYCVDRWYGYCTGANVTGIQTAITGTTTSGTTAYRFTGAASVTSIGFGQRIEGRNSADLAGKTATLSVDLANSTLTSIGWTCYYANTPDNFGSLASPNKTGISSGTFTVSSTLARYSTTINIPAAATTGLEIVFTAGAQTSGTWTIDNVQLESGSVATPFEQRSYGQELALCMRYCQKFKIFPSASFDSFMSYYGGTNALSSVKRLTTPMRGTPTASFTNASVQYYSYAGAWTNTTLLASIIDEQIYYIYCSSDGDGRSKLMRNGNNSLDPDPTVTFSVEL